MTALVLILTGVFLSALPLLGLRMLATSAPLLGAFLAIIGAALYFIDGAWEWGLAGVGALMLSIVILLAFGPRAAAPAPPVVTFAPAPAPPPATTQSILVNPDAKVTLIAPGQYQIRAPGAKDDPVNYWQPVLQDQDPKIRIIALERLARVPEKIRPSAADAIARATTDRDPAVRKTAIPALALAHTPQTVAAAIAALDDPDPALAQAALKVLARFKDDAAIDPLARHYFALGAPVLQALSGYDAAASEKITTAYQSLLAASDPEARATFIEALALADPAAAAQLLMLNLSDADPALRHLAMARLAEMDDRSAIPAIAQHLADDPDAARAALLKFGPAAEKAVAARLADPDAKLRLRALDLLKTLGTADSLPAIKAVAKGTDFASALAAREVWRKIEPGAFPPVAEALYDLDGRKEFVTRALATLKTLPPDDHQKTIAKKLFDLMLADSDPDTRTSALEALQTWADADVKDALIARLKGDLDESQRALAIQLAVFFKDPRAVKPLCDCLAAGQNLSVVLPALREFDTLPEEYLMPLLAKADGAVRANCFDLLQAIGTRRCFGVLSALMKDKTTDAPTRQRAKETLINITRRLNTAEAQAARKKASTPHPPPRGQAERGPTTAPSAPAPAGESLRGVGK
jgi:HEAT repeat protein